MVEELYKKYIKMYQEFSKIDDFNLKERALRIPAEKHFWVEKMIDAKRNLYKLEKRKKKLVDETTKQLVSGKTPVRLDKNMLNSLNETEEIEKISDDIQEYILLVKFLEVTVSNISYIAQDIKNIIEISKLENE